MEAGWKELMNFFDVKELLFSFLFLVLLLLLIVRYSQFR